MSTEQLDPIGEREMALEVPDRPIEVVKTPSAGIWTPDYMGPVMSRRTFNSRAWKLGLTFLAAAALGGADFALEESRQISEAEQTFNAWLDGVAASYPKVEQMQAMAEACGVATIDLDKIQTQTGIEGGLDMVQYIFGTSNNFGNGLDNGGGPYKQPNSVGEVAFGALDDRARKILRAGNLLAATFAHPGSYSGNGDYPGTTTGSSDCLLGEGQMRHPEFQRLARQSKALQVARVEGGYDDLRILFVTLNQMAARLTDVLQLARSNSLSNDVERTLNEFLGSVRGIAQGVGDHFFEAAAILNDINNERGQNGQLPMIGLFPFTWRLDRGRIPFGPLVKGGSTGKVGDYLHDDRTGPPELGRMYLDLRQFPGDIGRKFAFIGWAEIFLEQVNALQRVRQHFPNLQLAIEDLTDINLLPDFYAAMVPYQATNAPIDPSAKVDPLGGGHPGMIKGRVGGIQHLASHNLGVFGREVEAQQKTYAAYAGSLLVAA